jgi:hypothetical protein
MSLQKNQPRRRNRFLGSLKVYEFGLCPEPLFWSELENPNIHHVSLDARGGKEVI